MNFDHDSFYEWVKAQKVPVFVSEYDSPLTQVAEWPKRKKMSTPQKDKCGLGSVTERLFFNGTLDEYKQLMEER